MSSQPPTFTTGLFQRIRAAEDDEKARRAAFDELSLHFWPVLNEWARRRGAAPEAAEEVAQQVLLKVWRHVDAFNEERGRPRQWMYGIFRNSLAELQAHQQRWHALLTPEQEEGLRSAEARDDLVREVMMRELLELARERVAAELPKQVPAFEALESGQSPEAAAARLGLQVSSVLQYHRNVRRRVEEELRALQREHA
jgi:RNA polymerase sigma-70 factor (ECF subfamily)